MELLKDGLIWFENPSQFNKDFIENCNGVSNKGYFIEVVV